MSPSVIDVARLCDVSPSTVCRALNGKADINKETKRRILAACAELGYTKNRGASNLRIGRSTTIACLFSDHANELFIEKLHFLKTEVVAAGYTPRIYSYREQDEAARFLAEIVSSRPAGLIADLHPDAEMKRLIRANRLAVVCYDRDVPGMDCVVLDRRAGSREAVRHLIEQGRTRIALLGAHVDSERGMGYAEALQEARIPIAAELVLDAPFARDLFRYGCEQIGAAWPALRFDALYTVNDASAIGAIRALSELGARVPEDVAVVGFDDIMVGAVTVPSLSTVRQPKEEMALASVRFLANRLADYEHPRQSVRLETRLVVRESSRVK